jgi:hypothetical protein
MMQLDLELASTDVDLDSLDSTSGRVVPQRTYSTDEPKVLFMSYQVHKQ